MTLGKSIVLKPCTPKKNVGEAVPFIYAFDPNAFEYMFQNNNAIVLDFLECVFVKP